MVRTGYQVRVYTTCDRVLYKTSKKQEYKQLEQAKIMYYCTGNYRIIMMSF